MVMKFLKNTLVFLSAFFLCFLLTACSFSDISDIVSEILGGEDNSENTITLDSIPEFSSEPYVELHGNKPVFDTSDGEKGSFETYSPLDSLGRCGVAYANIGVDLMPTEKRGNISHVKPSGWDSVKYNHVEGRYLYNRCHLIGFQLSGENANPKNLITGTRYLNVDGMLPFENEVAEYVKETENHVLYRVTPIFEGDNLVASGVQMEAWSVEDEGESVCFNIFAYNCQPGVTIDYATGASKASEQGDDADSSSKKSTDEDLSENTDKKEKKQNYVINKKTKKFHNPDCTSIASTDEENKESVKEKRSELIANGYDPCGNCKP